MDDVMEARRRRTENARKAKAERVKKLRLEAAAAELREAGWIVIEPGGSSIVIDRDGTRWERGDDGMYRLDGDLTCQARSLDYIREMYGLRSEDRA